MSSLQLDRVFLPNVYFKCTLELNNKNVNVEVKMESWPSGRRRSPAKGVTALNPFESSNLSLSAIFILIDMMVV